MITCSDGKFFPLMVHDKNGNPLALLQLSKQLWKAVGKLQKSEGAWETKYIFIILKI